MQNALENLPTFSENSDYVKWAKQNPEKAQEELDEFNEQQRRDAAESYKKARQAKNVELSGIPSKYQNCMISGYEVHKDNRDMQKVIADLIEYCKNGWWKDHRVLDSGKIIPKGLLFSGPTGSGKTHLMSAIGMYMIRPSVWDMSIRVRFIKASLFLENCSMSIGGTKDKEINDNTPTSLSELRKQKPTVILLDDLGASNMSQFKESKLLDMFDWISEDDITLIITTNVPAESFFADDIRERLESNGKKLARPFLDARARSRISELCTILTIDSGKDRRSSSFSLSLD